MPAWAGKYSVHARWRTKSRTLQSGLPTTYRDPDGKDQGLLPFTIHLRIAGKSQPLPKGNQEEARAQLVNSIWGFVTASDNSILNRWAWLELRRLPTRQNGFNRRKNGLGSTMLDRHC